MHERNMGPYRCFLYINSFIISAAKIKPPLQKITQSGGNHHTHRQRDTFRE